MLKQAAIADLSREQLIDIAVAAAPVAWPMMWQQENGERKLCQSVFDRALANLRDVYGKALDSVTRHAA